MKREPVKLDPRRNFTRPQKAKLFQLAEGRCQVDGCGNKIMGTWIAGHYPIPHNLGGRTIIKNGRVEGLCCAPKTHKEDTKTAAKTKRMARETGQQARRERNGSQIQSRGFQTDLTRDFDGKVRKRKKRKRL